MKYPLMKLLDQRIGTLVYFLTHRCNASCHMCYNYQELNKDSSFELTVREIESICRNLKKLILLQCSGGEPFLKEDIQEILSIFASITAAITIATNALLSEKIEQITSRLVSQNKNTLFRLSLSLDGLGDLHDKIRNYPGGFEQALETLARLKKIRLKNRNLILHINTVLTKINELYVSETIDYVHSLEVDHHTITYMWGNPKNARSLTASVDSYRQACQYLHAKNYGNTKNIFFKKIPRLINQLSDLTMLDILEKQKRISHCQAIKKFAVMLPNGDILPCHLRRENLGNVRQYNYDIQKILKAGKALAVKSKIGSQKCWCTAQCNNRNNVLYSKKSILYLFKYFPRLRY